MKPTWIAQSLDSVLEEWLEQEGLDDSSQTEGRYDDYINGAYDFKEHLRKWLNNLEKEEGR